MTYTFNEQEMQLLLKAVQAKLLSNIVDTFKTGLDKIPKVYQPVYRALIEDLPTFPISTDINDFKL